MALINYEIILDNSKITWLNSDYFKYHTERLLIE